MKAEDIKDGVYAVRTALDQRFIWDVKGGAKTSGTQLIIFTQNANSNAGNHQRYYVQTVDNSGTKTIRVMHTGYNVVAYGIGNVAPSSVPSGKYIAQQNISGGATTSERYACWHFIDTTDTGGRDCVYVVSSLNQEFTVDVQGGTTANSTNLILYKENADVQRGDHQKWFFEPVTVYDSSLPAAYSLAATIPASGDAPQTLLAYTSDGTLAPTWSCSSGNVFQLRYRTRNIAISGQAAGDWSEWKSPYAEEVGDEGWGDEWQDYFTALGNNPGTFTMPGDQIPVSFGTWPAIEIQYEVRRFEASRKAAQMALAGPVSGPSVAQTIRCVRRQTLALHDFKKTAGGLSFGYTASGTRPGQASEMTVVGEGGRVIANFTGPAWNAMAQRGTLHVPFTELERVPENGEQLAVTLSYKSFGLVEQVTATGEVVYDASWGYEFSCAAHQENGWVWRVTPPVGAVNSAAFVEQDGRLTPCLGSPEAGFVVVPPRGGAAEVIVIASNSDNQWGQETISLSDPGMPESHALNWDGGFIAFGSGCAISLESGRDHTAVSANGSVRENVYYGDTVATGIALDAIVPMSMHFSYIAKIADAGDATLRTPDGDVYQVAITSVNQNPSEGNARQVSISMRERQ